MKRLIIGFALTAIACGGKSPTAPSVPVQVAGVWRTSARVTSVSGGDCFAAQLQTLVGSQFTSTLSITQNGSHLAATETDDSTGDVTAYEGTAGENSIVLNGTYSSAAILRATCPNGAGNRDMVMRTSAINANIAGRSGTGTVAQSGNIYIAGTNTSVGLLTLNGSVTLTRQ